MVMPGLIYLKIRQAQKRKGAVRNAEIATREAQEATARANEIIRSMPADVLNNSTNAGYSECSSILSMATVPMVSTQSPVVTIEEISVKLTDEYVRDLQTCCSLLTLVTAAMKENGGMSICTAELVAHVQDMANEWLNSRIPRMEVQRRFCSYSEVISACKNSLRSGLNALDDVIDAFPESQ